MIHSLLSSVQKDSWPGCCVRVCVRLAVFVNDIKGYSNFAAKDWYPRPDCFLASWDVEKNLYALVMADADDTGVHKVHENELTFDEVKMVIPKLASGPARTSKRAINGQLWRPLCRSAPKTSRARVCACSTQSLACSLSLCVSLLSLSLSLSLSVSLCLSLSISCSLLLALCH